MQGIDEVYVFVLRVPRKTCDQYELQDPNFQISGMYIILNYAV